MREATEQVVQSLTQIENKRKTDENVVNFLKEENGWV